MQPGALLTESAPDKALHLTASSVRSYIAWSSHPSTHMHGYRPFVDGKYVIR